MIEIKVRLFGLFRSYGLGSEVVLEVPAGTSLNRFKEEFKAKFGSQIGDSKIVDESAIASESRVLKPEDSLSLPCTLAILPPVCGG